MEVGIDWSKDGDVTVYTIPHKKAFELMERQLCQQFHGTGEFSTVTRAEVEGDQITFYVQIKKKATPTEEQSDG